MSPRVFISYRRDDSAYAARGVHDRLEREFCRESLFMDVDAIALGVDFVGVLVTEVAKCDVLLAIIGPDWLDARDEEGHRRLENENDFVRIEIAAALKRDIPVIPILLEGTRLPKVEQLPGNLEGLARRNGMDVRHASFHNDLDRLVLALRRLSPAPRAPTAAPPVCPSEPASNSEAFSSSVITGDDRSDGVPLPSSGGEPDREAKPELPAKVRRPVGSRGPIGLWLLLVVLLVPAVLGIFSYVDRPGKPLPSAPSDPGPAEPGPLIDPSSKLLRTEPGAPLVTGGSSLITAGQETTKSPKQGSEFADCANVCPAMIVVPAGKFIMGSPKKERRRYADEGPQHEVTFAEPFAVAKYEVTLAEWDACVAAGACPQVEDEWGRGRMPVMNVSWDDAKQYARWLSQLTGKAYRLLTEAEWEYAARAGAETAYSWGDVPRQGNANCAGCGSHWDEKQTAPVGSFEPNAFGLYDMHGNVWEWVEDSWHDSYSGAPADGSAWLRGGEEGNRVKRGGSWADVSSFLRVAIRGRAAQGDRNNFVGFRVARSMTP
jgi:formylglycine-generating enzyme required for sulfatase activity